MKHIFTLLFIAAWFVGLSGLSAQDIGLERWRDHLPYAQTHSVTSSLTRVYCAAKNSLFYLDKTDNTVNRITTLNGLSDVELSKIKYNPATQLLIITYLNGNIDLMRENGEIINVSSIKNSNLTGSKEIFNIELEDELAYLSTGLGIVVFDTKRIEIKDTYFIGTSKNLVEVFDVALNEDSIYAAAENGVYVGARSANLADYRSWKRVDDLPSATFNILTWMGDTLLANEEGELGVISDTVHLRNAAGEWSQYGIFGDTGDIIKNYDLAILNGKLIVPQRFAMWIFDRNFTPIDKIYTYVNQFAPQPREVIYKDERYWIADAGTGLVGLIDNFNVERITLNGPLSERAFDLAIADGVVWSVAGGYTGNFANLFFPPIISRLKENSWINFTRENEPLLQPEYDLVSVAIDPLNTEHVFASSWGNGVVEINEGKVIKVYNFKNRGEHSLGFRAVDSAVYVGGLDFDDDGNLWMSNPFNFNLISVLTEEGEWRAFNLQGMFDAGAAFAQILADRNDNVWVLQPRDDRIVVYNHGGTPTDLSDDPLPVVLSNSERQGDLPGDHVFCIAEDKNGEIWVGTNEGVAVFYNTSAIFNGGDFDAQQILIQQDGTTQILFENESITAIAIDGANRKWIGTQNAGVFLMSADGTEQIEHFTSDNSPLLSNNITSIAIDGNTGEVYFGTESGLISYRGTATEGNLEISDVEVFPNPVKKDFTGKIAIRGLTEGAVVKITNASGGLVYETQSLGGQAVWDGNNFDGNRVETGVYLIFSASSDGEQTNVSKVMILN